MRTLTYDIAVVGSGFAGSLLAMIAKRLGRSVILLEKGKHPRFAIGESSTPLTNLLLEELTSQYGLPELASFSKWGSWQRAHPDIPSGLKRGFSFYHHTLGRTFKPDAAHSNELLVAASPHDEIADTHWYRAGFDHYFVQQAQSLGVEYLDNVNLTSASESDDGMRLTGTRDEGEFCLHANFVVDATGPRGFLHRALNLPELTLPGFPATQALYSHFSQVQRLEGIILGPSNGTPPYPIDDAAVHHIFDGGWIWVLQFNNGITSAGVAATNKIAEQLRFQDGGAAWTRLLDLIPPLKEQFREAKVERPFTHAPRLSFRSGSITGRHWALLPSAAGFVDPLLSTGFALTLLGVARLAELIDQHWGSKSLQTGLKTYASQTDNELLTAGRLIGSLYKSMHDFPLFVSLTFLYFSAVIFSETARRLGKKKLASSFLLWDRPDFGPRCLEIFERVQKTSSTLERRKIEADILETIEPLNLAGLGDAQRRNWYPVDTADLYAGASKVGATHDEISEMLARIGCPSDRQVKTESLPGEDEEPSDNWNKPCGGIPRVAVRPSTDSGNGAAGGDSRLSPGATDPRKALL